MVGAGGTGGDGEDFTVSTFTGAPYGVWTRLFAGLSPDVSPQETGGFSYLSSISR